MQRAGGLDVRAGGELERVLRPLFINRAGPAAGHAEEETGRDRLTVDMNLRSARCRLDADNERGDSRTGGEDENDEALKEVHDCFTARLGERGTSLCC